jgi:transposase-like protein
VSLLVAMWVNGEGYREILGICEGAKEDKAGWSAFLKRGCYTSRDSLVSVPRCDAICFGSFAAGAALA